jgi:large subunit ribosomal protein L47
LVGRGWKASELRLKSWDDLHKLWYVLLKEKNMLMSQRQMLASESMRFPNPERISKVYLLPQANAIHSSSS